MHLLKKLITSAMHSQLSKLDGLYQRHAGEECYIFGNGVSLKWMDLNQFSDKPAFLGNMMNFHREVKALKAAYYTLIEPFWFWPYFPERGEDKFRVFRNPANGEHRRFISQNPETLFFLNFSNYPVARFSNALYVSRFYKPPFSKNNPFAEREDAHSGTFRFHLALAIYMGFKKAYLVGQDYTHYPSKSFHFYEKGEGILDKNKDFCRDFIGYARRHIDLVTVTINSGSETMPSMTYKQLTGKEPRFRENTDLVDRSDLERLDSFKWFCIF